MLSPRIIPSSTCHVGSNCHKWSKRLNFTFGLHFYLILLHSINSVLWHMAFWKALFPQDHIPSALCFSCWCRALCWETKVFSVLLTLPSVKANHVVAIILAPCTYLPFFAHTMHILTTLFIILLFRCRSQKRAWPHPSFFSWNCFGSVHAEKKRQVTEQMLSLMEGNAGCPFGAFKLQPCQWARLEPSFLLQKRIHDAGCLGVPHAARGPCALR